MDININRPNDNVRTISIPPLMDNENYNDDELGFNMLANTKNQREAEKNTSSVNYVGGLNEQKMSTPKHQQPSPRQQSHHPANQSDNFFVDDSYNQKIFMDVDNVSHAGSEFKSDRSENHSIMNEKDVVMEKRKLLFRLRRCEKKYKIKLSKPFSMSSTLEELRQELDMVQKEVRLEQSIKMARNGLIFVVGGMEMLNTKFDPFDMMLDGWSEQVNEEIDDYDEVFEELYDKYYESVQVAPEFRLMMMIAGSAFNYHLKMASFMRNSDNGKKKYSANNISGPEDIDDIMRDFDNSRVDEEPSKINFK